MLNMFSNTRQSDVEVFRCSPDDVDEMQMPGMAIEEAFDDGASSAPLTPRKRRTTMRKNGNNSAHSTENLIVPRTRVVESSTTTGADSSPNVLRVARRASDWDIDLKSSAISSRGRSSSTSQSMHKSHLRGRLEHHDVRQRSSSTAGRMTGADPCRVHSGSISTPSDAFESPSPDDTWGDRARGRDIGDARGSVSGHSAVASTANAFNSGQLMSGDGGTFVAGDTSISIPEMIGAVQGQSSGIGSSGSHIMEQLHQMQMQMQMQMQQSQQAVFQQQPGMAPFQYSAQTFQQSQTPLQTQLTGSPLPFQPVVTPTYPNDGQGAAVDKIDIDELDVDELSICAEQLRMQLNISSAFGKQIKQQVKASAENLTIQFQLLNAMRDFCGDPRADTPPTATIDTIPATPSMSEVALTANSTTTAAAGTTASKDLTAETALEGTISIGFGADKNPEICGPWGLRTGESFMTLENSVAVSGFVSLPTPPMTLVMGKIIRTNTNIFAMEHECLDGGKSTKLMTAKRERRGKNICYVISTTENTRIGKLKVDHGSSRFWVTDENKTQVAKVNYVKKGKNGPRLMLITLGTGVDNNTHHLVNRPPKYDAHKKVYRIDFYGRVTLSSIKNFQLVPDGRDDDPVALNFGKISDNGFNMDFRAPLSPLQAFAISLSTFETSITEKKLFG